MTDDEILNQLLSEVVHMVVAVTLDDGTPWAVPVHIKHHDGKQFVWESKPATVHSQAITKNAQVCLLIFSIDRDIGFYAKAHAEEVPGSRNTDGYAKYSATISESWLNEKHTKRPVPL